MRLLRLLSRWRHGRGFGVHSPLAYELISTVLPDSPAYYADTAINASARSRRQARIGRIVVRLVARFRPATVCCPPEWRQAVRAADSRIRLVDRHDDADMAIEDCDSAVSIRIGRQDNPGPLTLTNESDLTINVYRRGLSRQTINTIL